MSCALSLKKGGETKTKDVSCSGGLARNTIRYTTCGYHCTSKCILKVHIKEGKIVACEPDDTVNPGMGREDEYLSEEALNRSMIQTRPCPKGYAQSRVLYDPNRLKYPMKRIGPRGEAKFKRISWGEALDIITSKMLEVKENYGPTSILHQPYSGLETCSFPLAPWFGVGFAGWYAHSLNGWSEPDLWVYNKKIPELIQDEVNIFKSKLVVLWGSNPASTHPCGLVYNLLIAKERGIPIISIEPRYTPSSEVLADQWIPIRPTTDVAMMIAMANVWFKEDLIDREFVEKWVEPDGLKQWKDYVMGAEDGTDKTPQWAEKICGVPSETIIDFARLYARSKPVNLSVSASIGRQFFGENHTRAAMYLQALTGNTLIPGGTAASETNLWQGHPSLPKPMVDWQRKPGTYTPPVRICMYKWAKAIVMKERLDKGEISREEYNRAIGSAPEDDPVNIQMVFLESNNHLNSLPDINTTIRAFKKLNFVVVWSYYMDMPSARYADVLLPQISTAFEGRDCGWCIGPRNSDLFHMSAGLGNYFIYSQKCVDAPDEVKSSDWFWVQIAKRLGIAELFSPRLADVPDEQWDEAIDELHREAYEKWAMSEKIAPLHPLSWEEFQKKPVFRWEIKDPYHAFKNELVSGKSPFKGTTSGKIEFYSKELAKGPDYLKSHEFYPGSAKYYGGGNLPPMAKMVKGGKDTFYSRDTQKYPLLMSSPHSLYRMHSFLDNQLLLNVDCYRHAVWISVPDAKLRGIVDDDLVKIYNDIGEMIIPAYVTSRAVPGTVYIFHGGWYVPDEAVSPVMPDGIDRRGAPNLVTHNEDLPDTIIGFFPCKGLVQIEKWEGR
ncbi:MAG: molybdopterin-dependent oxidoreductase [Deltaproteobacteria bacterium]|nr:molybdopterin-dependent oxidoreductase [Deltaproteobacteria bacterium]